MSHCCQQWGLATSPDTVFDAHSYPFPKLGMALPHPFQAERMRHLDTTNPDFIARL
jgi:hypothetical protein